LRWLVLPVLACAFGIIAASVLAGRPGLLISLSMVAAVPLLVVFAELFRAPQVGTSANRRPTDDGWQTFHDIAAELGWAKVSRRHFDRTPRRMLQRIAAAALDDRAGLDFYSARDRQQAIALIGPQLWPLLDPQRPPSTDSDAPGVDPRTIDRLLTRLETL
jgi:hypothetical protein